MPRPSLRMIVVVTAALAGVKVWAQDRYYRTIYHEALIAAYEERARTGCSKEIAKTSVRGAAPVRLTPAGVVIGSPDARVALWDIDNPLWDVRYRHPHLLLTSEPTGSVRCAFDLFAGLASLDER